jgi:hypothetical protein
MALAPLTAAAQVPTHLPPVAPQAFAAQPATQPVLPEPIYWKQQLFLIPYQWGSAAQSSAAQSVTLYASKDRGASWQKISEAKPHVKAFNYRAEGDGEYWFAVRTLDGRGRLWPEGPYQAELRVIVDTTIPRVDSLIARPAENGAVEIECRATDINLDPATLKVEAQTDAASLWQVVALQFPAGNPLPAPGSPLIARFQPTGGVRPFAVRATIADRAGNTAVYQTPVSAMPAGPALSQPVLSAPNSFAPAAAAPASASPNPYVAPPAATAPPAAQPWAANAVTRAPFRLWTSGMSQQDDGLTAYGTPQVSTLSPSAAAAPPPVNQPDSRVPAQYAGLTNRPADSSTWTSTATGPQFSPLEPFREAGQYAPQTPSNVPASQPPANPSVAATAPILVPFGTPAAPVASATPVGAQPTTHRPAVPPKLVGSRTFALEYDLEGACRGGVTKVELWGTRDGGQTWSRFSQDDDNRSPLIVTVDNEGLYGFKIIVQTSSGAPIAVPRAGEEPELWVAVDLRRPIIELTSIERGEGNLADHLVLHWRAQDNNLEPRPISLYFSSRPGGPWNAIATNLEDTGQYAWRVERYVPSRIYLRVEARDVAGNLAAFQTREPVEFSSGQLTGRLRTVSPPAANR